MPGPQMSHESIHDLDGHPGLPRNAADDGAVEHDLPPLASGRAHARDNGVGLGHDLVFGDFGYPRGLLLETDPVGAFAVPVQTDDVPRELMRILNQAAMVGVTLDNDQVRFFPGPGEGHAGPPNNYYV